MAAIDFHTHAFPDQLAAVTIPALATQGSVKPALDGTIASLKASMVVNDIQASVICCIATRPEQFSSILNWCQKISSEKIIPFPSVHPSSPNLIPEIKEIKKQGYKGIKLHPYYQDFFIDEARLTPLFSELEKEEMIIVLHSGYDIGFPEERRADPKMIRELSERFPGLKIVAAHLGSWQQWDEVRRDLYGSRVWLDTSFSLQYLEKEEASSLIKEHGPEKVLFGSDSPWADQGDSLGLIKKLNLSERGKEAIIGNNARLLLDLN